MKLQHRAWLMVVVVVGLAALGAMFGARYIIGESFAKLETERVDREAERARRLLAQQLNELQATARDYAWWAESVAFVQGRSPRYAKENLSAESLASLRISGALLVSRNGTRVAALGRVGDDMVPLAEPVIQRLEPLIRRLQEDKDAKSDIGSYLVVDDQMWLVAAATVHDPELTSPKPEGVLVMARHFDQAELRRFADVFMMPLALTLEPHAHGDDKLYTAVLDEGRRQVHALLRDHEGHSVGELILTLDRGLEQASEALTWTGMALALVAGLLASMVLVPVLDRLMLRRLQNLHADVQRLTNEGPIASGPVPVRGRDEIGQLATAVNHLVDRVREDRRVQQEAHERQEALQMQLAHSQKTEALGRLTGGIAHDFNNSLAAITGWVRLAAEDLADGHPSQEALQQALKATRYADGLMRQLLAFGRQAPPRLRQLHWSSLIEETRLLVAPGLTRGCALEVEYRAVDDEVDADPTQLQQVMVNLLINAADAMGGQGTITVRLDALELPAPGNHLVPDEFLVLPAGHYLVLSITDQGPGVPADLRQRLFEPFYTTKAKGKGTGLGLSVAQGIVARHHGAIGLISEPGHGACFQVCLPVSRHDGAVQPHTAPGDLSADGRRLLFVDDDQLVRHAWSALLERKGWQVTRARDGEEAWVHFAKTGKQWDLVLTDQSMPRLDGVGLARRIHETSSPPPVVLMSGHVNEVPSEDLQSLFAAVLHKPVEATELEDVLSSLLPAPSAPASTH